MVTVTGPVVAELEAARVSVLLFPVVDGGLKAAVTPPGKPLALKATLLVNPPVRLIVIVLAPLAPRFTVRLAGLAERVKSGVGGALIVRINAIVRVSPPPTPLIVTFVIPVAAVLDAARVNALLFPVVEVGLNVAVTPLGNPLALRATLLVNPPVRVIVIVLPPLAPRLMVRLEGVAASEKFCGLTIERVNGVERVRPPPEPLIVTLKVPNAAALDAARVNILLPPVVEGGLNAAVTPLGNPLALKATLLVNPPLRVILIVLTPLAPGLTVRLDGFAARLKSGALTVRLKVVERLRPPPEPLIVTLTAPVVAVFEAASVKVLLAPVVEAGLNVAVTPLGNPVALKATLLVNPPLRVILMVLAPLAPRLMVRLDGFAASVKFGAPPGPCQVRKIASAGLPRGL
jgi:hypothetical protein